MRTRIPIAMLALLLVLPAPRAARAQGSSPSPVPQGGGAQPEKLNPEQLDALVAPIALYPDDLLSQALIASTYPLELIQAQQFVAKNPKLKGDELVKAVEKQNWDPSVQATAVLPDLLKRLSEDITWTTNLGNAFLAQQGDVMDAVQRLRMKAKNDGKLQSNDKMVVETKVVEKETVVVIQPASTQVVYVPTYNPTVIWGPPPPYYPYPPVYYPPPPPPGAMLFSFGVGMMWGAAIANGPCCSCGWGHGGGNTVVINNNNNFVNNYNRQNNISNSGNSNWQHNSQHRGGAPYGDRATATKYGGNTRGGAASGARGASASTMDRGGGAGGQNRAAPSTMNRGGATGAPNRAAPSSMDRGGGQIGNQAVRPSPGGSAFGGSGSSSSRAKASSSRGSASMSARPAPSGGRGGGGRGGGRR